MPLSKPPNLWLNPNCYPPCISDELNPCTVKAAPSSPPRAYIATRDWSPGNGTSSFVPSPFPQKEHAANCRRKPPENLSKNLRKTIQEFDYRTLTYIDNKMKLAQTKQCCPAVARDATKLEANVLLARILNDTQCIVPRWATHKVHSTKIISPSICEIQLICSNLNACKNQTSSCNIFLFCHLWSPPKFRCVFLLCMNPKLSLSSARCTDSRATEPLPTCAQPLRKCDPHLVSLAAPHQLEPKGTCMSDVRRGSVQPARRVGSAYRSCSSSPVFAWSWLISISCNQIGNHASSPLVHGPTHNQIASSPCTLEVTPRLRLLFHASLCLLEMIVSVSWLAHLQPCLYESWS